MSAIATGDWTANLPEPFAGLAAVAEPFGWPQRVTPVSYLGPPPGPWFWVEFEALIKPPPELSAPARWEELAGHRKAFCARGEELIAAVEAAGWKHDEPPEIRVRGQKQWPDGRHKPPVIFTEATVEMRLLPPREE